MKRLLPLLLLPFLAACEVPPETSGDPAVADPLPPQVLAALPAGVPPSVVTRNVDGCYLLTLEVTDPPTGFPLRDAAGNQVCEGSAAVADVATVPASPEVAVTPTPLIPGGITPPAPLAPLNPG